MGSFSRRQALRVLGGGAALAASHTMPAWGQASDPIIAGRPLVRYPQKTDLILLTSRPPQLETPMKWFDRAITPNEAFFVRYHVFPIPTSVDLATWRLRVGGHVDRPLELSMDELKTRFPRLAVTAVNQCSGNSRGRFAPRVLGGQWGDGAMGNAEWVGCRLKDLLAAAGVRQGAVEVTFDGLDKPAFPSVPDFVKSLPLGRVLGPYSFRGWSGAWTPPRWGAAKVMVRAFNRIGESQGTEPLWNPAGYLRNVIESVEYQVG